MRRDVYVVCCTLNVAYVETLQTPVFAREILRRNSQSRNVPKFEGSFTTTPDTPPPQLRCPTCELALLYRQTLIEAVDPSERSDYFECLVCGLFEFRHRTRRLSQTDGVPFHIGVPHPLAFGPSMN